MDPNEFHENAEDLVKDLARTCNEMLLALEQWAEELVDACTTFKNVSFADDLKKAGCAEVLDPKAPYNAVFNSFVYPPDDGSSSFTNSIAYGPVALENKEKFFAARCHEYVHAMQYAHAPVLHADPFNAGTDIVLCPHDYVYRKQLIEQDAYAKGAWLCSLAAENHPLVVEAMEGIPLSVRTFNAIRAAAKTFPETLQNAARQAADTEGFWIKGIEHKIPVRDAWHEQALGEYGRIIEARIKDGKEIVLVHMEDADIHAIGHAFGHNPFGNRIPELCLSPENRVLLEQLNEKLGIKDENALPSFAEALEAQGLTPEEFLARSKGKKAVPAKTKNALDLPKI